MSARIIQGNVFDVLPKLKRGSVDCLVTSPPYWMLRSYLPKGHALKHLELGSEPTPQAYAKNMVKVFSLVRDVMAEHGTCWLNIGDSYAAGGNGPGSGKQLTNVGSNTPPRRTDGIDSGNLCLIPQRLAIALQDDGWIVRSVIVWHKPAPMPSSVSGWAWRRCRVKAKSGAVKRHGQDGVREPHGATISQRGQRSRADIPDTVQGRSRDFNSSTGWIGGPEWSDCPGCDKCAPHGGYRLRRGSWRPTSSWEPVLMLAKSTGYFADGEPVRQPSAAATVSRNEYTRVLDDPDEQFAVKHDHETTASGANLRDVWQSKLADLSKEELIDMIRGMDDGSLGDVWRIAAEPLSEKHYAAFPTELVHRCLASGTSAKGYCPACGAPWVRCVETSYRSNPGHHWGPRGDSNRHPGERTDLPPNSELPESKTTGWRQSCPCPHSDPRPGLVLDPFAGSGRTGIEALRMGLDFVGVELNPEYVAMARKLLRAESPLFAEVTP